MEFDINTENSCLISNINDGNFKSSLHIMILGISGTEASPFEGFPAENINTNSSMLKTLKPITKIVDDLLVIIPKVTASKFAKKLQAYFYTL